MSTPNYEWKACFKTLEDLGGVSLKFLDDRSVRVAAHKHTMFIDVQGHDATVSFRNKVNFPHPVICVFPVCSDRTACESRVYVVVDGPYHLVEINITRQNDEQRTPLVVWRVVSDAATQDDFMPRAFTDMSIVDMVPSQTGNLVAVLRTNSTAVVYRVASDHGRPTFEALQFIRFTEQETVLSMAWDMGEDSISAHVRSTDGTERTVVTDIKDPLIPKL